ISKLPDPRKLLRGTSYTAKGALKPPKNNDIELGSSFQGQLREVVPELGSIYQAVQTYPKMSPSAVVRPSPRAARPGFLGAVYFVQPHAEKPENIESAKFDILRAVGTAWYIEPSSGTTS